MLKNYVECPAFELDIPHLNDVWMTKFIELLQYSDLSHIVCILRCLINFLHFLNSYHFIVFEIQALIYGSESATAYLLNNLILTQHQFWSWCYLLIGWRTVSRCVRH